MARIATGCSPDPRLGSGAHRRGHHGDVAKAGLEWPGPVSPAHARLRGLRTQRDDGLRRSPPGRRCGRRRASSPMPRAGLSQRRKRQPRGRVFRPGRGCRIHQRRTITGSLSRPCRSYRVGRWHRRWCRCPAKPPVPGAVAVAADAGVATVTAGPRHAAGTGTDGDAGADATVAASAAVRYRHATPPVPPAPP